MRTALLLGRARLAADVFKDSELAEPMTTRDVDRAAAGIALDLLGAFASDLVFELAIAAAHELERTPVVAEAIRQLQVGADPQINPLASLEDAPPSPAEPLT